MHPGRTPSQSIRRAEPLRAEPPLRALARRRRQRPTGRRADDTDAPEPDDDARSMRRAGRSIRSASTGTYRRIKWAVLLSRSASITSAVRALGPRAERARPGRADRFSELALLLLLHRDLAAGDLLPHRPADHCGDDAVPDERASPDASGAAISVRRRCGPTCSRPSSAGTRATGASISCATSSRGRPIGWRAAVSSTFSG